MMARARILELCRVSLVLGPRFAPKLKKTKKRMMMPNSPLRIEKKAVPHPQKSLKDSWVFRASPKKVRAMAGGVGMAVFGSAMLVDKLFTRRGRAPKLTMA